jgi:hypothetical protein
MVPNLSPMRLLYNDDIFILDIYLLSSSPSNRQTESIK